MPSSLHLEVTNYLRIPRKRLRQGSPRDFSFHFFDPAGLTPGAPALSEYISSRGNSHKMYDQSQEHCGVQA